MILDLESSRHGRDYSTPYSSLTLSATVTFVWVRSTGDHLLENTVCGSDENEKGVMKIEGEVGGEVTSRPQCETSATLSTTPLQNYRASLSDTSR